MYFNVDKVSDTKFDLEVEISGNPEDSVEELCIGIYSVVKKLSGDDEEAFYCILEQVLEFLGSEDTIENFLGFK